MMIPRQRGEPLPNRDTTGDRYATSAGEHYGAWLWPTVDETRDVLAAMTADTVLQILRGQGISWGLGTASEPPTYPRARRGPTIKPVIRAFPCGEDSGP
jgi:hypothetical protein